MKYKIHYITVHTLNLAYEPYKFSTHSHTLILQINFNFVARCNGNAWAADVGLEQAVVAGQRGKRVSADVNCEPRKGKDRRWKPVSDDW
jgi:hypothetical protein